MGIGDILLDHALLVVLQLSDIVDDRYFTAAGEISRLTDPNVFRLLSLTLHTREILNELLIFIR